MMTGGGSAVKRLNCGIIAVGEAIAGGSSAIVAISVFWLLALPR